MLKRFRAWWPTILKVLRAAWVGVTRIEVIFALIYYGGHVLHRVAV